VCLARRQGDALSSKLGCPLRQFYPSPELAMVHWKRTAMLAAHQPVLFNKGNQPLRGPVFPENASGKDVLSSNQHNQTKP
jgi:hypothetical protein